MYLNETALLNEKQALIAEYLQQQPNLVFGVSQLPVPGLIVRILGYSGELLHGCLKKLAQLVTEVPVVTENPVLHAG